MAPQPHSQAQRYMLRSSVKHLSRTPTKQLSKRKPSTRRKMAEHEQLDRKMWQPDVEKVFIELMVEERNKGKTLPFGRKIWSEMRAKLNERGNREFTSKQCREKYQRIRRSFNHFTRLIKQKGFSWDAEANTVIAEEETWQKYLLANNHAKKFRIKGMANYKLLALIFNSKATATGVHRQPPNSSCGSSMDPEFLDMQKPEPDADNSSSDSDDEDWHGKLAILRKQFKKESLFLRKMIKGGHLVQLPTLKRICPLLFGQWKLPAMLAKDKGLADIKIQVLELVLDHALSVHFKC